MKHHFETLGLQEGVSQQEIRETFDRLSKELNPANNDNQEFFVEEYEKVQKAYKALNQTSILKNSDSSSGSFSSKKLEDSSSSSKDPGSFTVTISPEKIEELKNKAQESKEQSYVKPSMFRNSFSFEGRIRGLEYGLSFIIYYIWMFFSAFVAFSINGDNFEGIYYLLLIPGFYFWIAQGAKRCHDRGNSGWYQLIPFYAFWMLFGDGDIGANNYGVNPKGIHKIK
jgi:uncharacterized membrane protein YhaH (DUF805 family)